MFFRTPLAAFISRQIQGGAELDGTDGWIDCHNSKQRCFGLMHTPEITCEQA